MDPWKSAEESKYMLVLARGLVKEVLLALLFFTYLD